MKEHQESLAALRGEIDEINEQLLALIQQRGELVLEIARVKQAGGLEGPDPEREADILRRLTAHADGPFGAPAIRDIFKAILRASLDIQEEARHALMRVLRRAISFRAGGIRVGDVAIGAGVPVIIAGPCSIESREQMEEVAALVAALPGLRILRGGAYKPRTNPYTFQGLREEGLDILRETAGAPRAAHRDRGARHGTLDAGRRPHGHAPGRRAQHVQHRAAEGDRAGCASRCCSSAASWPRSRSCCSPPSTS